MAYKIPVSNYPNQTFNVSIPVDEGNIEFEFTLNYNVIADYWVMSAKNAKTQEVLFSRLPLLVSYMRFSNILSQMGYKLIGSAFPFPIQWTKLARPNDDDLGKNYTLLWSDSNV